MSHKIAFTPSQIIRAAKHARENNEPFLQVCPVADKPKLCHLYIYNRKSRDYVPLRMKCRSQHIVGKIFNMHNDDYTRPRFTFVLDLKHPDPVQKVFAEAMMLLHNEMQSMKRLKECLSPIYVKESGDPLFKANLRTMWNNKMLITAKLRDVSCNAEIAPERLDYKNIHTSIPPQSVVSCVIEMYEIVKLDDSGKQWLKTVINKADVTPYEHVPEAISCQTSDEDGSEDDFDDTF
jgi:hypothetical protein